MASTLGLITRLIRHISFMKLIDDPLTPSNCWFEWNRILKLHYKPFRSWHIVGIMHIPNLVLKIYICWRWRIYLMSNVSNIGIHWWTTSCQTIPTTCLNITLSYMKSGLKWRASLRLSSGAKATNTLTKEAVRKTLWWEPSTHRAWS